MPNSISDSSMNAKPSVRCPYLFPKVYKAISSLKEEKGSTVRTITNEVHDYLKSAGLATKNRNIIMQVRRALKYGLKKKFIAHRAGKYRLAALGKKEPVPVDSLEIVDKKRRMNFTGKSSSRGKSLMNRVLTRIGQGTTKKVGFSSMRSNNRSSLRRSKYSSPRKSILGRPKSCNKSRSPRQLSRKPIRKRTAFARKIRRPSPLKGVRKFNFGLKRYQSTPSYDTNSPSDCSDSSSRLKIKRKKSSSISSTDVEGVHSNISVGNESKCKSVNFRDPPNHASETAVEEEDKEHGDFNNVRPNSNDKALDRTNPRKQTPYPAYLMSEDEVRSIPRPRRRRRRRIVRSGPHQLDNNLADDEQELHDSVEVVSSSGEGGRLLLLAKKSSSRKTIASSRKRSISIERGSRKKSPTPIFGDVSFLVEDKSTEDNY